MQAKKCSRCGQFYSQKCIPDLTVNIYIHGYGDQKLDLCLNCSKELINWCNFKGKLKESFINGLEVCYEN